ncbi:hypothetical protein L1887_22881 [Cichorium endivia]|nr:hypothetical protein L1887_22881 [Cichorium endivia]
MVHRLLPLNRRPILRHLRSTQDEKSTREYVMDLIRQPGNMYNPDSSIMEIYFRRCLHHFKAQTVVIAEPKEMRCVPLERNYRVCEVVETPKVRSSQILVESDGKCRGNFPVTTPCYLNLESSLAMDWLEIAWDELHIKERIGARSFRTVHRPEWHGSVSLFYKPYNDFCGATHNQFL